MLQDFASFIGKVWELLLQLIIGGSLGLLIFRGWRGRRRGFSRLRLTLADYRLPVWFLIRGVWGCISIVRGSSAGAGTLWDGARDLNGRGVLGQVERGLLVLRV